MRTAIFLVLPTTLILSTSHCALAQLGNYLELVKGDTPNSPTPSCSFTSDTILSPVPIVQGLLGVQPGDPPEQVEAAVRFPPDQPYSNEVLQWTAQRGENYVKAVVNFRNNGALTRSFTAAINYQQPDEKQCEWQVRDTQQGGTQLNVPPQPLTPP